MGIVYDAYDQRLERRVAVKRMLSRGDDVRRRERLRREARTLAQLSHPAIIQIFDLIEDDAYDWIVMELVDGPPLASMLESGPLSVDQTLGYAVQIAKGLEAAHRLGIVHRDLKTENVMVLSDGRVKILDFGIAKRLDVASEQRPEKALSRPGEVMGTGRAMAPEQARGLAVSPRSDLFSFGVLLYEMTTGLSPFRAKSSIKTLTRIITHQPTPVDEVERGVPRGLADLVERLLCKAPELRPASAGEVVQDLEHLVAAGGLDVRQPLVDDHESEATVLGTEWADSSPIKPTSRFYDFDVRLLTRPGIGLAASLTLVVLVSLFLTWAGLGLRLAAPDLAASAPRPVVEDPLRGYEEGMALLRRIDQPKNIQRAIVTFHRMIEENSNSAAAHAGLSRAYWEKSRNAAAGGDPVFLEQALTVAREGVRLDPYLSDARTSLGLVQYAQGNYDAASHELELALELDPAQADALYGLGKVAEAMSNPQEAETRYRQATDLRQEPLFYDAQGSFLYDQGRYDNAEAAFLKSLAIAPDDIYALRNLGSIYFAQDRTDEAASMLQSALKIRPNASLYSNLGTIFFSRGLYSKAAVTFEDALRMDGAANRYIFWLNLADAYRQIPGKEDAARQTYQRALQMLDDMIASAPNNVRLLSRRALGRSRVGDRVGAREDLALLRQLGTSGDLYTLFRMAVAEELCGNREDALASLEQALHSGFSVAEARYEPDLQALRQDLRFHHMLVALEGRP